MEDGAYAEVASTLRQVIAQMPAYAPAYVLLAQAYEALERWPEARETWQRAHFFAPNSPVVEAGLLRMIDRADAAFEEDAGETAFEVSTSDVLDRLADELIETIRDEPSASGAPPVEETAPAHPPETADADEAPRPPSAPAEPSSDAEEAPLEASPPEQPPDERSPLDELAHRLPPPDQPLPPDVQDLDRLIDELEGARIDPQPDLEEVPPPDLDNDIEDMVSETLARIYISQKQYVEAARIYQRLAAQEPEQEEEYLQKAADMRMRAREQDEESR